MSGLWWNSGEVIVKIISVIVNGYRNISIGVDYVIIWFNLILVMRNEVL